MPTRLIYRRISILALAIMLVCAMPLVPTNSASAGGECPVTYLTRRGDTLKSVAVQWGVQPTALAMANKGHIGVSGQIRSNVRLCIPFPGSPESRSSIATRLESSFIYTPTQAERDWSLTRDLGYIGRYLTFPLESVQPLIVVTDTVHFAAVISASLASDILPILIAFANSDKANDYTLGVIGRPDILSTLHISDAVSVSLPENSPVSVSTALATTNVLSTEVKFWVEFPDSVRYPYLITKVMLMPADVSAFRKFLMPNARFIAFVLLPSTVEPGHYRLIVVIKKGGPSDPGTGDDYLICQLLPRNGVTGLIWRWACR